MKIAIAFSLVAWSALGAGISDAGAGEMSDETLRKKINLKQYVTDTVGLPTLEDIMEELIPEDVYDEILEWHYQVEKEENELLMRPTCAPHYYRIVRQKAKAEGEKFKRRNLKFSTGGSKGCLAGQLICLLDVDGVSLDVATGESVALFAFWEVSLQVIETTERSAVLELLKLEEQIDLVIPRGDTALAEGDFIWISTTPERVNEILALFGKPIQSWEQFSRTVIEHKDDPIPVTIRHHDQLSWQTHALG